ncbi:acetoacetate decarboxylase family protein [Bacillus sp. B15-48]|uniref:acetoacetate decarboxylase family protein n=1 Tax=Bacillus sp. B15-48 TaxID=1548601 RepID=UPI0019401575|nr:acetoacetate decarboxylase family protein [Bacillus sp. B15-48]MBM4763716.1 hypothetical protein [Bacillus sp. B15-48]
MTEKAMGRLTKDKFGFSMPVDQPLYQKPPFYYRDLHTITITYETDKDAALAVLPEGLEMPIPATTRIVVAHQPFTTFGPYEEAYQLIDCLWEGKPCIFPVRILLDTEAPMAAGRELWGNPKKLGHVEWTQENEIMQGVAERPKGSRIFTLLMKPERPVEIAPYEMNPVGLRVIPNPEESAEPSLSELILNTCYVRPIEAWSGTASLSFGVLSALDPWHTLPVKRVIDCVYARADMDVAPSAKIIKRY